MDADRLGKYEIRSTLGRGAMGTVFMAWDPVISRNVAIKTVRLPDAADIDAQEELARFKREAQAAGRLTHPNIVGVFDYGETEQVAYIVMEFVDGHTLKSVLDSGDRMTVEGVGRVMADLLAGLRYSHERGVIHRDIKPANIMITGGDGHGSGQAKIADFGIARIESSNMTQAGTIMGTPAYMSPEQFMGQTVDARTDIYSSGVLLFQLLTGERPFEGSMATIMHKALNTTPPKPSELSVTAPVSLDAVVSRAMARRPEDRFPTASAFAEALQAAMAAPAGGPGAGLGVGLGMGLGDLDGGDATVISTAPKPVAASPAKPAAAPAQRSRLPVIAAAAILVLALAGGGAWFALSRGTGGTQVAEAGPGRAEPQAAPAAAASSVPASQPAPAPVARVEPPVTAPPITLPPVATPPPSAPLAQAPVSPPRPPPAASTPTATQSPAGPPRPPPQVAAVVPPVTSAPIALPAIAPPPPPPAASPEPPRPQASAPPPEPPPMARTAVPASQPPPEPTPAIAPIPAAPPAPAPAAPAAAAPAPAHTTVASAGQTPEALRRAIATAVAATDCAVVSGDLVRPAGTVALHGVVGRGRPEQDLQRAVRDAAPTATVDWGLGVLEGPYCGVMNLVRAYARPFGATAGGVQIGLKDDRTSLFADDRVDIVATAPAFPAHLLVDYFSADGTVAHLHQASAGTAPLAAGSALPLYGGEVGEPFGTDLVVATAAALPLFAKDRALTEKTDDYVRDLRAALEAASRRGSRVATGAMMVRTSPRR